ncbi:hypothetical protein H1R20_g5556, partial [Candolleomyces eurysporus]
MPAKKAGREESEQEEWEDEEDEEEEDEGDEEENEGDEEEDEEEEEGEQAGREDADMGVQEDVLAQLLTHGAPLDDLGIEFSDTEGLECLLNRLGDSDASSKPRPWDCIKSLSLSFENDCQVGEPNVLKSLLLRLPKTITSFELHLPDSYTLPIDEPMFLQPMLQFPQIFAEKLTAFSISCDWGVQHMFGLLEHCANLEVLTLDFISMDDQWTAEQYIEAVSHLPQVKLPNLHTLRLRQSPPEIISALGTLQAPVLVNLDFEFADEGGIGLGDDLLTFLTTESNCAPLNSLRLTGVKLDAYEFCETLDELPALTRLVLDGISFDEDDLLQSLDERCKPFDFSHNGSAALRRPPFLPNLEVLELIGFVGEKNFHHLVGFISSREQLFRKWFGSDGRLKALTVAYDKDSSPLDLDSRERRDLKRRCMFLNVFPWSASLNMWH